MTKLSAIILAHNVEEEITPALKSAAFADEIIVVDTDQGSTDRTVAISKNHGAKIVKSPGYNFSTWRNDGAKAARGDWILYLDSDERITHLLSEEIKQTIINTEFTAFTIPRYEVFLGKHLDHWPDQRVLRLMKKKALKKWRGSLHEQPQIEGQIGELKQQLIHLSHKNIDEKIAGTMKWSKLEAEMLFKANHPPMKGWRFFRIMLTEFWHRFVKQGLWQDGIEGIIEVIYQMFSRFLTYERLWELQRQPSLKQTYKDIDKKLLKDI
jgi:glycosyltransferase involved in cell wall biosynthesis